LVFFSFPGWFFVWVYLGLLPFWSLFACSPQFFLMLMARQSQLLALTPPLFPFSQQLFCVFLDHRTWWRPACPTFFFVLIHNLEDILCTTSLFSSPILLFRFPLPFTFFCSQTVLGFSRTSGSAGEFHVGIGELVILGPFFLLVIGAPWSCTPFFRLTTSVFGMC